MSFVCVRIGNLNPLDVYLKFMSDENGTDAKKTLKQSRNPHPDAAENASLPGWLYTLNSFLERAFTEADRATGC